MYNKSSNQIKAKSQLFSHLGKLVIDYICADSLINCVEKLVKHTVELVSGIFASHDLCSSALILMYVL